MIELVADDPDSRVLVAQVAPAETLAATVTSALGRLDRLSGGARLLARDEALSIPRLSLDLEGHFGELMGRPLLGEELRGKRFDEGRRWGGRGETRPWSRLRGSGVMMPVRPDRETRPRLTPGRGRRPGLRAQLTESVQLFLCTAVRSPVLASIARPDDQRSGPRNHPARSCSGKEPSCEHLRS